MNYCTGTEGSQRWPSECANMPIGVRTATRPWSEIMAPGGIASSTSRRSMVIDPLGSTLIEPGSASAWRDLHLATVAGVADIVLVRERDSVSGGHALSSPEVETWAIGWSLRWTSGA